MPETSTQTHSTHAHPSVSSPAGSPLRNEMTAGKELHRDWSTVNKALDEQADYALEQMHALWHELGRQSRNIISPAGWTRAHPIGGVVTAAVAGFATARVIRKTAQAAQGTGSPEASGSTSGSNASEAASSGDAPDHKTRQQDWQSDAGTAKASASRNRKAPPADQPSVLKKISSKLIRLAYRHGLKLAKAGVLDMALRAVQKQGPAAEEDPARKSVAV